MNIDEINRIDLQPEFTESYIAQAMCKILQGVRLNNQTARDIVASIKRATNYPDTLFSHKFYQFLIDSLCPEAEDRPTKFSKDYFNTFLASMVSSDDSKEYNNYYLRDVLTNLGKLKLFMRETRVSVKSLNFSQTKGINVGHYLRFQYPLSCSITNQQMIDYINQISISNTRSLLFDNIRVLYSIPSEGGIFDLHLSSLLELTYLCSDTKQIDQFLSYCYNTNFEENAADFYKMRACSALQAFDIVNTKPLRYFPYFIISSKVPENARLCVALKYTLTKAVNAANLFKQSITLSLHNTSEPGDYTAFVSLYDIYSANVDVSSNYSFAFDGSLDPDCIIDYSQIVPILVDTINNDLRLDSGHTNRKLTILNGESKLIKCDQKAMVEDFMKISDVNYKNDIKISRLYRMAQFLTTEQIISFISVFYDAYFVRVNYMLHYAKLNSANYNDVTIADSNVLGYYLSNYHNPTLPNSSSHLYDSLRSCVNYGLLFTGNLTHEQTMVINPLAYNNIIFYCASSELVSFEVEQVFSLYAPKLLLQLESLRDTDYFYKKTSKGSFLLQLRQWLERFIPGFLKPPVINPFDMISQPFVRAPIYNNIKLPDRQVMLPDLSSYRNIYNN